MLTIHLTNLQFHCQHGLYAEEKKLGGDFVVHAHVEMEEPAAVITSLHQSLNYVQVYDIIKRRMGQPTQLLETIAMELATEILHASPLAKKVSISIAKQAAPIVNFTGQVGVEYTIERSSH